MHKKGEYEKLQLTESFQYYNRQQGSRKIKGKEQTLYISTIIRDEKELINVINGGQKESEYVNNKLVVDYQKSN